MLDEETSHGHQHSHDQRHEHTGQLVDVDWIADVVDKSGLVLRTTAFVFEPSTPNARLKQLGDNVQIRQYRRVQAIDRQL